MSNDNKTSINTHHRQHSDNQRPKRKRSLTGFISVIACLLILLLIASCQPVSPQIYTVSEGIADD